jgi:hypothetical protein
LATAALSLFGFLNEADAVNYLKTARPETTPPLDDAALKAEWTTARSALGAPPNNFGNPEIKALAGSGATYIASLRQQQWIATALQAPIYHNATFNLIEIDPLLAYQFHIGLDRSDFHCAKLSNPPT